MGAMMSGGGGGGDTTTTNKTVYSPEEEAARAKIFAEGGNLYNQQQPTSGQYLGPGVVGFSDPSQQAFGTQMRTAAAAQPTAMDALRTASFNMSPEARYVSSNPYAADAIKSALDPIQTSFTQGTLPSLRLNAQAQGSGMGTRQGVAEGLAAQAMQRTMANTASGMASNMYQQNQQNATQTAGLLPQIMQGATAPATMQSQVGTALENQAQQQENYSSAQRMQGVNGPWQMLQNWAGLVGGMSNPTTVATHSAPDRQGMNAAQGAGSIMSLLPLLAMFL